jgi:hypothetical protein
MAKKSNELENAKQVLNKHGEKLKKKYGINNLGIGYKTEGGELSERIAIICYYYKDKKNTNSVPTLPEEIDGIPLEVQVIGTFRPR